MGKPGNAKHQANSVNHGGGSTTGRLVRIAGKMTATMSRDIPDANLLQSTLDLRLGPTVHLSVAQDNKISKEEWLQDNSVNVLEWPSQIPDLIP